MRYIRTLILGLVAFAAISLTGGDSVAQSDELPAGYARLLVITNFENTEVQINNVSYPYEWIFAERQGVLLPANSPFMLTVSVSPEQVRRFRLNLDEGETRVIVVDIEHMGEIVRRAPEEEDEPEEEEEEDEEEGDATGYLGVSSSPRGIVYVDGENTGRRTPARRIEVDPGRHRVQVFYEDEEEMSETKYVLIRSGTNTNVFFRLRRSDD